MPPRCSLSCRRKHCPRQGKCSCCVPPHTNFKSCWRRVSTHRLAWALPKARPEFVLHLAAHQLQRRAPIQCDATILQLIMPAEHLCSCHVPQNIDLMLRWRWNSTRQPTEALPKAGQVLMLHLTAQLLQSRAPIQCYATPLQRIVALTALTARRQFASTSLTTGPGH